MGASFAVLVPFAWVLLAWVESGLPVLVDGIGEGWSLGTSFKTDIPGDCRVSKVTDAFRIL